MDYEYEKFYPEISEISGVYRITVPKQIMEGAGWKVGDKLKVLAVKQEEEPKKEKEEVSE